MKKKNGSFVVLFRDDAKREVFLVYRSDWPIWNLTGGGVEKGEDPKNTAIREALEETGFKIKIIRKVGVYEYFHPKTDQFINYSYLFEGRFLSGSFKPEFPGCKGEWFDLSKLPVDLTDQTRQRIIEAERHVGKPFEKKVYRAQLFNNLHLLLRHPISAIKYFSRK